MVAWCALWVTGCTGPAADDGNLEAQRQRFLLNDEPVDAVGVLDARESLQGEASVVVVGKVGGVPEPWREGRAAFMIADASMLSGGPHEECDDPGCPFCNKQPDDTEALALVQVVDDAGDVVPIDARALFDLADKQTVVVEGSARLHETGFLVISARGVYVRR